MNLDGLISKYIDGELTEYEDDFLRQRISADKSSQKKFDDAINLSIAFKEDAKTIVPPADLIDRTEDIILMKILAKAPEYKRRRAFVWSNASMLAASIIALMFLMVFQISDYSYKNKSKITKHSGIANLTKTENKIEDINLSNSSKSKTKSSLKYKKNIIVKNQSKKFVKKESKKIFAGSAIKTELTDKATEQFAGNNFAMNKQTDDKIDNSTIPVNISAQNSDFNTIEKNNISTLNTVIQNENHYSDSDNLASIQINSIINENSIAYFPDNFMYNNSYIDNNKEVQVASFFGTDIVRTGKNATSTAISHFSQSVAYAVNKKERIGVELGYTEYTYNENAVVNVKKKMGSLIAGVESNETGYGFSINYQQPIVLKNSKQMIWASVFYENSFWTTNSLALIGRVGLGATNEGPLGYGRIFTKYNLFSSFDLTLGAEGRLYSAQLPEFVGDNNKFNASCSLIYGFQFKF